MPRGRPGSPGGGSTMPRPSSATFARLLCELPPSLPRQSLACMHVAMQARTATGDAAMWIHGQNATCPETRCQRISIMVLMCCLSTTSTTGQEGLSPMRARQQTGAPPERCRGKWPAVQGAGDDRQVQGERAMGHHPVDLHPRAAHRPHHPGQCEAPSACCCHHACVPYTSMPCCVSAGCLAMHRAWARPLLPICCRSAGPFNVSAGSLSPEAC